MIYGTVAGRIVRDAELRFLADGTPVLGFTVASDVGYGEKKHAVFVKCSMWGKRGESVASYVTKGSPVTVIGGMDLREWESNGKSGKDLELKVAELVLQGGRQSGSQDGGAPAAPKPSDSGFRQPPPQQKEPDFADDDIPF